MTNELQTLPLEDQEPLQEQLGQLHEQLEDFKTQEKELNRRFQDLAQRQAAAGQASTEADRNYNTVMNNEGKQLQEKKAQKAVLEAELEANKNAREVYGALSDIDVQTVSDMLKDEDLVNEAMAKLASPENDTVLRLLQDWVNASALKDEAEAAFDTVDAEFCDKKDALEEKKADKEALEQESKAAWDAYWNAFQEYTQMFTIYTVTNEKASFVIGEDKSASFHIEAPYDYLNKVYIGTGEEVVDPSNYDVTEGSTVITFHQDYLEGLGEGEYTFRAEYVNGLTGPMLLTISKALPKPVEEPKEEEPKQDEQKQEEQKPADNKTDEQKKDEQKPVENKTEQNNAGSGLDKNGRPITGDAGVLSYVMMFISSASAMGYCVVRRKKED